MCRRGGRRVGRVDLDELREAAGDARRWDSKYGGGNWKANSVTAELSRLAGWTFDVRHEALLTGFGSSG